MLIFKDKIYLEELIKLFGGSDFINIEQMCIILSLFNYDT